MTKKPSFLLSALIVFAFAIFSMAQYGTQSAQQSPTMANATTKVASANAAINNQVTATATPASSNYVYVTGVDLEVCQNATGLAQTLVAFNWTAGITPSGTIPIWQYSTALSVNTCQYKDITFPVPLKSITPGTAVTLQSPAASAQAAYTINVFWYEGQ